MAKTAIVQNAENPEPLEVIADAVIAVSEGFKAIQRSRLSQRAVELLIQDATGLPRKDIRLVIEQGARLKDYYIKKAPVTK